MIEGLIRERIKKAEAGNVESARWLMEEFVATVKNNRDQNGAPHKKPSGIHTQFHESILDWFTDCFQKIIGGVDAKKALGIKRERGRQPNPGLLHDEDCQICLAVLDHRYNQGADTLKEAKQKAARQLKIRVGKVGHAWKNPIAQTAAKTSFQMLKEKGDK